MAPDERASLLAYRTAVIFPVKVAETPVFPVKSAGVTAAGLGAAASAELQVDPQTAEFTSSKPADEAAEGSSSDSSSSSSSDSDSDSDDELSQAKTQISEPTVKHESGDRKVTSKLKDDAEESQPKYDRGSARETNKFVVPTAEICSEGTQGAAAGAVSGAPAAAEEPGHSPESTEVTASPAGPDVSAEDVSTASRPADDSADVPAGTKGSTSAGSPKAPKAADGAGAEAAGVLEGSSSPADAAVEPPEVAEAEASSSTESSEELMDAAPVRAESVVEELQPEGTHHTTPLHFPASTTEQTLFSHSADVFALLGSVFRCNLVSVQDAGLFEPRLQGFLLHLALYSNSRLPSLLNFCQSKPSFKNLSVRWDVQTAA